MTSLPRGERRLTGDHAAILPDIFRLLQLEMPNAKDATSSFVPFSLDNPVKCIDLPVAVH